MEDFQKKAQDFFKNVSNPFQTGGGQKFQGRGNRLGGGDGPTSSSSSGVRPSVGPEVRRSSGGGASSNSSGSWNPVTASRSAGPGASGANTRISRPESVGARSSSITSPSPDVQAQPKQDMIVKDPAKSSTATGTSDNSGSTSQSISPGVQSSSLPSIATHVIHSTGMFVKKAEEPATCTASLTPEVQEDLHGEAAMFLSTQPDDATLDILLRLLKNVVKEPSVPKFQRIRLSNPKIANTIGASQGAMTLLAALGFQVREEEVEEDVSNNAAESSDAAQVKVKAEPWAVLQDSSAESVLALKEVLTVLEVSMGRQPSFLPAATTSSAAAAPLDSVPPAKSVDRQLRVFLPSSESAASRISIPDSFFDRSGEEVRQEALARRKAAEASQQLLTRAMRERQAGLLKRRYKRAIMRFLFPDGLVLQGVFRPSESTAALYQFVAEALKDPAQEFDLLHPIPSQRNSQVLPAVVAPVAATATSSSHNRQQQQQQLGGQPRVLPTLEQADLVPASLIKFKASCLGPPGYTGLRRELLEAAEPLASVPLPEAETSSAQHDMSSMRLG